MSAVENLKKFLEKFPDSKFCPSCVIIEAVGKNDLKTLKWLHEMEHLFALSLDSIVQETENNKQACEYCREYFSFVIMTKHSTSMYQHIDRPNYDAYGW
jgi:hypothetical protein